MSTGCYGIVYIKGISIYVVVIDKISGRNSIIENNLHKTKYSAITRQKYVIGNGRDRNHSEFWVSWFGLRYLIV